MAVSAKQVKALRELTGLGMMDCKAALEEADGDLDAAVDGLRRKSALKAAKKSGRTAAQGLLGLQVTADGKRAALVEVNIETDFAARNPKFVSFVDRVAAAALETGEDAQALAAAFAAEREALVQEIGENLEVRRAACLAAEDGCVGSYLHNDRRKGALVELSLADSELGRELAMHVTAHDPTPLAVFAEQLDEAAVAKERDIIAARTAAEVAEQEQRTGKAVPSAVVEKRVEGRLRKFFAEVSLMDQAFVKDPQRKVGELLRGKGAAVGRFARLEVGEGIAVAEQDFAAEVAAQVGRSARPAGGAA